MFSEFQKQKEFFQMFTKIYFWNMFIHTENYTESHEIFLITISNTKHTQKTHIQKQLSQNYINVGLPRPLQTAFELKKIVLPT